MNVPVSTTLDTRYSDPAASAITWEETSRILDSSEIFLVTTVRSDGRPHSTPVVAVLVDGAIAFTTGPGEQKHLNLQGNPHVLLTAGCSHWDHGIDVIIEGDALLATDEETLARVAAAFTKRWDGRWQWKVSNGGLAPADHDDAGLAEVFLVRPVKAFAHAKGDPFGATTHKFRP